MGRSTRPEAEFALGLRAGSRGRDWRPHPGRSPPFALALYPNAEWAARTQTQRFEDENEDEDETDPQRSTRGAQRLQRAPDGIDHLVGRGGSGRQADGLDALEPLRVEVVRPF